MNFPNALSFWKRHLLPIFAILLFQTATHADPLQVTQSQAVQRPGTKLVDITYSLSGGVPPYSVTLEGSLDGGNTWTLPMATVSGNIGSVTTGGNGKIATWNAGADWDGGISTLVKFRVNVVDSTSPQVDENGVFTFHPADESRSPAGLSVIARDDGGFWAFYRVNNPAAELLAQHFNNVGNLVGTPVVISDESNSQKNSVFATSLPNGGAALAWIADETEGSMLKLQTITAGGSRGVAPVRLNPDHNIESGQVSILSFGNDSVVVLWLERQNDVSRYVLRYKVFDSVGQPRNYSTESGIVVPNEGQLVVKGLSGNNPPAFSAAKLMNGRIVVGWQDSTWSPRDAHTGAISGTTFPLTFSDPFSIASSIRAYGFQKPQLYPHSTGGFVATYGRAFSGFSTTRSRYAQLMDASGEMVGSPINGPSDSNGLTTFEILLPVGQDNFIALFNEFYSDLQMRTRAQLFDEGGQAVGESTQVGSVGRFLRVNDAALVSQGRIAIGYSNGELYLYEQSLNPVGESLGRIEHPGTVAPNISPLTSVDAFLVWWHEGGQVRGRRLRSDGTPLFPGE